MNTSLVGIPHRLARRSYTIMFAVLLCVSQAARPQTPNLTYTKDYPSVERVRAEIRGSDPTDTLARQTGVLAYLSAEIKRIKLNRDYRGQYTPDELRLITAYDLAAYNNVQDYKKSHTPDEFQAFDRLQFNYTIDPAFRADWTKRLIGPQGQAAYSGAQADLAAGQRRRNEEIKRQNEEAMKQAAASGPVDKTKDPTAVATRRCLELGGGPLTCMGKSFTSGLMGMALGAAGLDPESITGPGRAGVVLSGRYRNPATLASLDFGPDSATIVGCGKLVSDPHGYTLSKTPGSLQVTLANEPHPIVLSMRSDGGLAGPGPVDVKGRIIIGYHTVTKTLYINGQVATGGSCGGVCTTSESVPDYAPKIERCTIGALNAPPPVKPQSGPAMSDGLGAMAMLLTAGTGGTDGPPPLPGLRMTGQFTGSGLSILFDAGNAILDCGEAHVRTSYTVENAPNELLVHVQNSGGPFNLTVLPDNGLRGSGVTTVNGRLVTGINGDNVAYAPHSESCNVGTLSPKAGSTPGTSVAAAPAPATPVTRVASSAGASPAAASSAARSANTLPATPSAHLQISTAFPSGSNPLAGRSIVLYKDSYPNVLTRAGATVAPGATPGQAMKAWVVSCRPPADCRATAVGMEPFVAGRAQIDSTGHATLVPSTIPPGLYYVSASARAGSSVLVWDVKVELKPGDNSVVLDPSNAEDVP